MENFNEYQDTIRQFVTYNRELGPFAVIMDLMSNVGILSGKLYNSLNDANGEFTNDEKLKIAISLGDILNNISNISADLNISMNEIISLNIKKLEMMTRENTQ